MSGSAYQFECVCGKKFVVEAATPPNSCLLLYGICQQCTRRLVVMWSYEIERAKLETRVNLGTEGESPQDVE